MYELRKLTQESAVKEVIFTDMNLTTMQNIVAKIVEKYNLRNNKKFFDIYEIEELETGLMNEEILLVI